MAIKYRTMNKNVRPMPLNVSSEVFVEEIKAIRKDHTREMTALLEMVRPFLTRWEQCLRGGIEKDVSFIAMCRTLSPNPSTALKMIRKWVRWADSLSSVYEELEFIFINRLRGLKYFPVMAAPIMAEYVIAKDFRLKLKRKIDDAQQTKYLSAVSSSGGLDPVKHAGTEELMLADHYFLKHVKLTKYERYLLHLMKRDIDLYILYTMLHLKINTILAEKRRLWQKLEKSWSEA